MGILYSRSIGALSAKGDYIFPIDNDDLFLDKDVFSIVSNVAIRGNFDIVEFKGINTFEFADAFQAIDKAYALTKKVKFDGGFYRNDIGARALKALK